MRNNVEKTKKQIAKLRQEIQEQEKNLIKLKFVYKPFIKRPVSYFEKKLPTTSCPEILLEDINREDVLKRFLNYLLNNKEPTSLEMVLIAAGSCRFGNLVGEIKATLEQRIANTQEIIAEKQQSLLSMQEEQNTPRPALNSARFFNKHDSAEDNSLTEVIATPTAVQ